jgi:hypothetical protein
MNKGDLHCAEHDPMSTPFAGLTKGDVHGANPQGQ